MLARAPRTVYVHEPFALDAPGRGLCDIAPPCWYVHIREENEAPYLEPLRRTLALRYDLRAALSDPRSRSAPLRIARDWARYALGRARRSTPILKDPNAILSAEWLAERLGMSVVVLIRHPAAVADSLMRAGWGFDFSHLLRQRELMSGALAPFEEELREHCRREHDLLEQAALVWRVVHHVVLDYRRRRADWIFLRHEDLCADPPGGFQALFERLGLELSAGARAAVLEHSGGDNPRDRPPGADPVQHVRRDSARVPSAWREQLQAAEIDRLRALVGETASALYPDADW
jgi:hypothetical protein